MPLAAPQVGQKHTAVVHCDELDHVQFAVNVHGRFLQHGATDEVVFVTEAVDRSVTHHLAFDGNGPIHAAPLVVAQVRQSVPFSP